MSMTQVGIAALLLFLGSKALSATGFGIGMAFYLLALGAMLLRLMGERVFRYVVVMIIVSSSLLVLAREVANL